jgi:uncharacterized glyoxalase superfamily protein PhnB
LDQVNLITGNWQRSLDFCRKLGVVFPRPVRNAAGDLFHASSESAVGACLELDSAAFVPMWNAGWAGRSDLVGRLVLGFRLATRDAVDECFDKLTGDGHRGLRPPFDAFWGTRYAIAAMAASGAATKR